MSSRRPAPLSGSAHRRAGHKRDRRTTVALRRATAGNRAAKAEISNLRRWLAEGVAPPAGLVCAREIVRRALARGVHRDHHLIARLESAVDRLGLLSDARALGVAADALAEIRMLATDLARLIIPSDLPHQHQ